MSKISDFEKMAIIADKNGDIRFFPLSNMKRSKSGNDGWGEITIAIDNVTLSKLYRGELVGGIYAISKEQWNEIEANNEAV